MIKKNIYEDELQSKIAIFKSSKKDYNTDELRELAHIFGENDLTDLYKQTLMLLVQKDDSSAKDKIEFRKLIFNDHIKNKDILNDNDIKLADIVLKYCPVENEKLNIRIIKKVLKSLKHRSNKNYEKILEYLNYYDADILNRKPFYDLNYSDFDLFLIDKMKCFLNLGFYELAEDFYSNLNEDEIGNLAMFHIKYNLCKFRYLKSQYDKAYELYRDLVVFDRKDYLLILPIKFKDKKHKDVVYANILELFSVGINKNKGYYLKYIYDWIEKYDRQLFDKIKKFVKIDEQNHISVTKFYKFMNAITDFYIGKIKSFIHTGIIKNIDKKGFGFIEDSMGNRHFVHKKYIRKLKLDSRVMFIKETYHNKSNDEEIIVVIILKEMKTK